MLQNFDRHFKTIQSKFVWILNGIGKGEINWKCYVLTLTIETAYDIILNHVILQKIFSNF
jgi:hypothetical protein